jgi:hypothetical protein
MFSESDYYYESDYSYKKSSFNISQSTINIIIVVVLFVIFFFIFNYCSKNYFTNINNPSDDIIDDLKNELAFVKEELFNKNSFKLYEENNNVKNEEEKLKEIKEEKLKEIKEEKPNQTQKIYNTDFLLNGNVNITKQNQNPNPNANDFINYNNIVNVPSNDDVVIQPVAPPIIYDPIQNYDRLKLLDPLVDPRGRSSADQIPTPQVAAQLNFPTQGILDSYHRVGLLIAINKHERKDNRRNNYNDTDSYEDFGNIETDSHEDFGNVEKVVKGRKVNVDSDTNTGNYDNSSNNDKKSRMSRYNDSSSDLQTISSSDLQTISSSYNTKFKEKIIPNNVVLDIGDRDNDILELIGKKIAHDWYRYFTSISKGNKIIKINVNNRNRKELYDGDVVYIPILKRHYKVKIDKLDMIEYNPYFF